MEHGVGGAHRQLFIRRTAEKGFTHRVTGFAIELLEATPEALVVFAYLDMRAWSELLIGKMPGIEALPARF